MTTIASIIVAITMGFAQPVTMDDNGNIPPDGQVCVHSAVGGYNAVDPYAWKRARGEGGHLIVHCHHWFPVENWVGDQGHIR